MKIKLYKHFSLPVEIVLHTYNQLIEADESLTLCQKIGDVQNYRYTIHFVTYLQSGCVLYVPV